MSEGARAALGALREMGVPAWLVGGAVRDRLLGRATADYDVCVAADAGQTARRVGRAAGAHVFRLSEDFGAWRVIARDRSWNLDLLAVHPDGITADLAERDVTINAIATPLGSEELIDPFGGRADLAAGTLRMVSARSFSADPLRVLRLARLAAELDFAVEPATEAAAAAAAGGLAGVAAERVFAELKRTVASERAVRGLELLDRTGAMAAILPELSALEGVGQSHYHHLDVHGHTRAALAAAIEIERTPERWFPGNGAALDRFMSQPLADELTRWQALRIGALFHDIAKPQTRAVSAEGRTTFWDHDVHGAELARAVLGRLRASTRLREHVAALARHHLRLGFLVHTAPLDRRGVYRYLHACEPVEVDVTVLSLADRLATLGTGSQAAVARHLALAQELLGPALRWRAERPRVPVRGDELARELELPPGPELGRLRGSLEEAIYAGEIGSRQEVIEMARALADGASARDR